jgi:hypothetical protein
VVTDAALGDIIRHGQALPGRINRILDRAFTVGAAQGFNGKRPVSGDVDRAERSFRSTGAEPAGNPDALLTTGQPTRFHTLRRVVPAAWLRLIEINDCP